MEIIKDLNGKSLTVKICGRLDTTTAPKLDSELKDSITDITELILDFSSLEYISSAGLRVLLSTQKVMNKQGEMKLRGVNDTIMEVFEMTGFADMLTIE